MIIFRPHRRVVTPVPSENVQSQSDTVFPVDESEQLPNETGSKMSILQDLDFQRTLQLPNAQRLTPDLTTQTELPVDDDDSVSVADSQTSASTTSTVYNYQHATFGSKHWEKGIARVYQHVSMSNYRLW